MAHAIPASTRHSWRRRDLSRLFSLSDNETYADLVDSVRLLTQNRALRRTVRALLHVNRVLRQIFAATQGASKLLTRHARSIARLLKQHTVSSKRLARWLGANVRHLQAIAREHRQCRNSLLELCVIRHPSQLSLLEVSRIRKALVDANLSHWPRISIYWHLRRNKQIFCQSSTFYKYARILQPHRPVARRPKYRKGLRASHAGQYIHADITILKLADATKLYLYVVVDNYSRAIIGWTASLKKSAHTMAQTIQSALQILRQSSAPSLQTDLIVDDGSENRGAVLKMVEREKIRRLVAQQDITFSNSMVEYINRVIKRQYIRERVFANAKIANDFMEWVVHDYNTIRPHGQLQGFTPLVVLQGQKPMREGFPEEAKAAQRGRFEADRRAGCRLCVSSPASKRCKPRQLDWLAVESDKASNSSPANTRK